VYVARARGEPEARDDALALRLFQPDELPRELAFDHATVLADYLLFRESGSSAPLRLG
jgi:8-oxo-dGTP diphosphatase